MTKKAAKEILIGQEPHDTALGKRKKGRPANIISYKQQLWDDEVKPHLAEMARLTVSMALDGDPDMLKLLMNKGFPREIKTGQLEVTQDAATTLHNILLYARDGHCSIDEAVKLSTIVRERANVGEYKKLSEQLANVETWFKNKAEGLTNNIIEGSAFHGGEKEKLDRPSDKE